MSHTRPRPTVRPVTVLALLGAALLLTACAAGTNPAAGTAGAEAGDPAGFWLGLWHGAIAPVTFVISLFTETVNVYEVHNSGNWYDGGFMLGLAISLGGSGASSR